MPSPRKSTLVIATCAAALVLLAGASGLGGAGSSPSIGQSAVASCIAVGGTMERRGVLRSRRCVIPFRDAGKLCVGKRDCEGSCLVPAARAHRDVPIAGRCQTEQPRFGCFAEVEDGRVATPIECVD